MHAPSWKVVALMGTLACIAALGGCCATCGGAEQRLSAAADYAVAHVPGDAVHIDGQLDEPAWQHAHILTDFKRYKGDGDLAEVRTRARLLWTDDALLVAFECRAATLASVGQARDEPQWDGQCAELFLAPRGADAPYFEFNFNPANAIYDSRIDDWRYEQLSQHWQAWSQAYNADITSAVAARHDAQGQVIGWVVEAVIPFTDLLIDADSPRPRAGDVWRFNACRIALKADGTQELSAWRLTRGDFHRPFEYPRLVFLGADREN